MLRRQRSVRFPLLLALVGLASTAPAIQRARFSGHCTAVVEADLVEIWRGPNEDIVRVRLVGVDQKSVERAYPHYARLLVRQLLYEKKVNVEMIDREEDGTIIGRVIAEHFDASFEIISAGIAKYDGKAPASLRLDLAEEQARTEARGLWRVEEASPVEKAARAEPSSLSDIAWKLDQERAKNPPPPPTSQEGKEALDITLRSWIGAHVEQVVVNWGPPDGVQSDGAGGLVVTYDRCEEAQDPESPCLDQFFVNANGYVYNRRWEEPSR